MEERPLILFAFLVVLLVAALWRRPAVLVAMLAVGSEFFRAMFSLVGITNRGEFINLMLPAAFGATLAILPIKLYSERRLRRNIFKHVKIVSLCAVVFAFVVILGMMRSPADVHIYGRTKVLKFLLANFFQFFFVLLFIADLREIKWCLGLVLTLAALQTLAIFYDRGWEALHTYFYYVDPPDMVGPLVLVQGLEMGYRFSIYTITCFLLSLYFRRIPIKLLFFGAASFCAFFCFMTACRGAMLFAGIIVSGLVLIWYRFRPWPLAIVVVFAVFLVQLFGTFAQDIHQRRWAELSGEMGSASSRAYMIKWALQDSRNHLLLGGGAGAAALMPLPIEQRKLGWYFADGIDRCYPHNGPVEVLDEFGLIGLVPYLLFFGMTAWKGLRTLFRLEFRSTAFMLCLWCLAVFGQDVMRMMISGDISDAFRAWIFAGLTLACVRGISMEMDEGEEEPVEEEVEDESQEPEGDEEQRETVGEAAIGPLGAEP